MDEAVFEVEGGSGPSGCRGGWAGGGVEGGVLVLGEDLVEDSRGLGHVCL